MVVEDIGNQHENVEFGFRINEELHEDWKEMLKNMSEIWKLDRARLLCLRKVEKVKLFIEVRKVNELLKKIESKDKTDLGGKEDWKIKLKGLTKIWGD